MERRTHRRRFGRLDAAAALRAAALVSLVAAGFAAVRFTPAADWFDAERIRFLVLSIDGAWWAPVVVVALYAVVAPLGLPVAPLLLGGAAFGPVRGTIVNTVGLLIGAATSYGTARALGRDFVARLGGRRLRRTERMLSRHGFWPLVQTRFAPVPFPVVNFGAALAGIRGRRFLVATALGIVPSTVVHTFFIARLLRVDASERAPWLVAYGGTFLALNAALSALWWRERRERRRRLAALRIERIRSRGPLPADGGRR